MAAALNSTSADLGNVHRPDTDESTEQFLMFGYKVVPCSKRYRHDWSVCPFSHTGEMAARRDPSRYLPIFCYHSKQRLPCPRGEECPYSHNLFEYWLHPQRCARVSAAPQPYAAAEAAVKRQTPSQVNLQHTAGVLAAP
eukprot:GHRQ01009032.1.p1 GENE.GHRQ01009032.1~~GHRQ01009032.1.p1  ORF type:complete len:139 (+),score=14.55 GHRQ01009032.1:106-522(+)